MPFAPRVPIKVRCPAIWVGGSDNSLARLWGGRLSTEEQFARLHHVPDIEIASIPDAGHMLHHDQPEALAALLLRFLA